MTKKIITTFAACTMILNLTGCAKEETSEPVVTTTAPIYVQEDGLAYAENEVIGSVTTATDAEGNPVETEDAPSATSPSGGGYNPTTTTKPSGGGYNPKPPYPTDPEKDSVYNTTVDPNIEETANITFGDVEVICKEEDGKSALGETITFGVNPYGFCRDILVGKGVMYVDAPLEIEVTPSEYCQYEFVFDGAGHTLKGVEPEKATMYFELQDEQGNVFEIDDVPSIDGVESYSVDVKAVASILDEDDISRITDTGKLKFNSLITVEYDVVTPDYPADAPLEICVGFPYADLVAAIGEGTEMRTEDGEQTYYVYKTTDHTLVIQHKVIEFVNKPIGETTEAVEKSSDVLSTVILIKNEITHDDETSEAEDVETEDRVYIPDTDINVTDVNLSYLKINGKQIRLRNATLNDTLKEIGYEHNPAGTTSRTTNGFTFESGMFGIPTSDGAFSGTNISFEVFTRQGEHIAPIDLDIALFDTYIIKGMYISEFWKKDDIKIEFCEGITIGTPKDDVVAALGEGTQMDGCVVYKSQEYTMVIEYKFSSEGRVVDGVYLLVNG